MQLTTARVLLLAAVPITLSTFGVVYGGLSLASSPERVVSERRAVEIEQDPVRRRGDIYAKQTPEAPEPPAPTAEPVPLARPDAPDRRAGRAPTRPTDRDLTRVASSLRRATARCAGAEAFDAELYVTFLGGNGRVATVDARGGDAVIGRCIEREAFGLTVRPFRQSSFVARVPVSSAPMRAAASELSSVPSRADVDRAFSNVSAALGRCVDGQGGEVQIAVMFAGISGEPTMVVVLPPWGGTEQGACMERAISSRAHVPPFELRSHSVTARLPLPGGAIGSSEGHGAR